MAKPRRRRNGIALARRYHAKSGTFERAAHAVMDLYFPYGGAVVSVVAAVVAMALGASFGSAVLIALFSFVIGTVAMLLGLAAAGGIATFVRWLGRTPEDDDRPIVPAIVLLPPPEPAPAADRGVARGLVRVVTSVTSPLSNTPCAAFRIVGTGPTGALDEALAGTFDVLVDGAPPIRVEADPATVDLPLPADPPVERHAARGPLARFMRERGACPHLGSLTIAETLLRDGDVVEVNGTPQQEMRPGAGYRDAVGTVLRDHPGSPLVIRVPAS